MKLIKGDKVYQYLGDKLTGVCNVIRTTPAGYAICKEGAKFRVDYGSDGIVATERWDGFQYNYNKIT